MFPSRGSREAFVKFCCRTKRTSWRAATPNIAGHHRWDQNDFSAAWSYGYACGSIANKMRNCLRGWTSNKNQLFWREQKGYKVPVNNGKPRSYEFRFSRNSTDLSWIWMGFFWQTMSFLSPMMLKIVRICVQDGKLREALNQIEDIAFFYIYIYIHILYVHIYNMFQMEAAVRLRSGCQGHFEQVKLRSFHWLMKLWKKIPINESTSQLKAPTLAIVGHLWLETMEFS